MVSLDRILIRYLLLPSTDGGFFPEPVYLGQKHIVSSFVACYLFV